MLIHHIYKSAAYVKARQPDIELSKPTQLAPSEVDCMARHLRVFEEAHPDNNKRFFLFTQGDLQYFLQAIFHNWNSSMSFGPEPVLQNRHFEDYAVEAGKFTKDLPPLPGQIGDTMVGRRFSDVAFLAITIRDFAIGGGLVTQWKDVYGNDVEDSKLYPQVASTLAPPLALARAVRNYDQCELERVMGYNFDLAVWWARRQIFLFSKKGVKDGAPPPRPEFQLPEKLVIAKAHIKEMVDLWSDVLDC
jgi:hypothetical protein